MSYIVHKLVEKKHIGYRYTTVDFITLESNNDRSSIEVSDLKGNKVLIDLTPTNIKMISEFFRYLSTDLVEEINNG